MHSFRAYGFSHLSLFPPPLQSINDGWDLRRTLKQNYDRMGLSTDPNVCLPIKKGDVQRKEEQADKLVPVTDSNVIMELNEIQSLEKPAPYQVKVNKSSPTMMTSADSRRSFIPKSLTFLILSYLLLFFLFPIQSMSIAEQLRLKTLIAKHKDDYAAMARDIKINTMQETEAVLKKRIALYNRLQSL